MVNYSSLNKSDSTKEKTFSINFYLGNIFVIFLRILVIRGIITLHIMLIVGIFG